MKIKRVKTFNSIMYERDMVFEQPNIFSIYKITKKQYFLFQLNKTETIVLFSISTNIRVYKLTSYAYFKISEKLKC